MTERFYSYTQETMMPQGGTAAFGGTFHKKAKGEHGESLNHEEARVTCVPLQALSVIITDLCLIY